MLTPEQRIALREGAITWNVDLSTSIIDAYDRFADLLALANQHTNLTRIPDEQIVPMHFLDSLSLAAAFPPAPNARLLDLGAGAGFPGLPLAIAYRQTDFVLLDGTGKKVAFLESVISTLALSNVKALKGRAEDLGRMPIHHGKYDMVTARAVAKLNELANWMLPFVRPGGVAIAYKGRDIGEEVKEAEDSIDAAGGSIESIFRIELPGTDIIRQLVIMRKRAIQASPPHRKFVRSHVRTTSAVKRAKPI